MSAAGPRQKQQIQSAAGSLQLLNRHSFQWNPWQVALVYRCLSFMFFLLQEEVVKAGPPVPVVVMKERPFSSRLSRYPMQTSSAIGKLRLNSSSVRVFVAAISWTSVEDADWCTARVFLRNAALMISRSSRSLRESSKVLHPILRFSIRLVTV